MDLCLHVSACVIIGSTFRLLQAQTTYFPESPIHTSSPLFEQVTGRVFNRVQRGGVLLRVIA